jgi:hypothetical protein
MGVGFAGSFMLLEPAAAPSIRASPGGSRDVACEEAEDRVVDRAWVLHARRPQSRRARRSNIITDANEHGAPGRRLEWLAETTAATKRQDAQHTHGGYVGAAVRA